MAVARSREARLPRLLLVDSDPELRESLGEVLGAVAEVETCPNAESAVFRLERKSYDIVVADHGLTGMKGIDLLHAVTAQEPEVAAVLMAASEDYRAGGKPRGLRVLLKPVEPSRLRATVRQLGSIVRMKRTVSEVRDRFS